MALPYNINSSVFGSLGFGQGAPDIIYNARLAATTDTSYTVLDRSAMGVAGSGASGINKALLVFYYEPDAHVFVALNDTAAAPAGASFASATSIINPPAMYVKFGDVVHFFAVNANTDVAVAQYYLQG